MNILHQAVCSECFWTGPRRRNNSSAETDLLEHIKSERHVEECKKGTGYLSTPTQEETP